jgi:hypothetical protein
MPSLTSLVAMLLTFAGASQAPRSRPPALDSGRDVQIRINGPIHIASGDTASSVWVVNHNAIIDGVVRHGLGVINGSATITGHVDGGVVVVNGRLELGPGARIGRDVMLYRSTLVRASDAVIGGVVHTQRGFSVGAGAAWLVWLSFTIVVVLAGLLFAEIAPVTLTESAAVLIGNGGRAVIAALLVVVGVPTLAVLSFATVIGIPLGLTLLLVVIPALTFLGYLVAGSVVGAAMVGRMSSSGEWAARYRAIALGLVMLQFAVALPVVGGLIGFIASLLGAGALVARSWTRRLRAMPTPAPLPVGA